MSRVKEPERQVVHSSARSAHVKNAWHYTSTPLYVLMTSRLSTRSVLPYTKYSTATSPRHCNYSDVTVRRVQWGNDRVNRSARRQFRQISGFRRDVDKICVLLWCYAALPTFRDNVSVPSSRVRSPSRKGFLTREDGTDTLSRNVGTKLQHDAA